MGTFLCGDHTRLLSLLKFLGDVPAAAALPCHPRLPFPPHPDCSSSTAGVQHFPATLLPSSPPPDGVHCLAHPGAGHRSMGLCPVAHSAGLPPVPGCSPVSSSWDSRGPSNLSCVPPPPPRHHSPPLQTAVQNCLLLEALPALYTPTAHRPFALGDWALQEGQAKITSLAQGRLLGNVS